MGEMLVEGTEGTLRLDGRGRIFVRGRAPAREVEHKYVVPPVHSDVIVNFDFC
jgi:hypothetical protein